ncbi:MAG: dihydrolipoamide acetyltransferase family protein [Pseudomonadota bacterium]|nr:dihydrolipoamide acetyltransferase family protein [Pseudomonadota bacterium]
MSKLRIPDLGEGVDEGTVLAVLVTAGAAVSEGQALLEVETDKVTFEIPSPRSGIIEELEVVADDIIRTGDIFARMSADQAAPASDQTRGVAATAGGAATVVDLGSDDDERDAISGDNTIQPSAAAPAASGIPTGRLTGSEVVRAGPAARREARELGIAIKAVPATRRRKRMTKDDVRRYARALLTADGATVSVEPRLPDLSAFGPVREVPLTRVEQATARNIARGTTFIPHAWIELKADVTALEARRREIRTAQAPSDPPLTMTAVLCKAVARALAEFPRFNAAIDMRTQTLLYRDYVNIGVAVDSDGNLLVPVVKDVPDLSVSRVAEELHRMSAAARRNRIEGADLRGAGITITNLGSIGISGIQPIINWPEVAIVGIAATEEVLRKSGNAVEARLLLPITLGFDHRANNGADAARFLNAICAALSEAAILSMID